MSEMPTSVRVGPFTYEIDLWPTAEAVAEDCWGQCIPSILNIKIREDLPVERMIETTWHELMHAAWAMGQLKDGAGEEEVISVLSPLIVMVLRDNPQLVRWIIESLGIES